MIENRVTADESREKLLKLQTKLSKLKTEITTLEKDLREYESRCLNHNWGPRKYIDIKDQFLRKCSLCGAMKYDKA